MKILIMITLLLLLLCGCGKTNEPTAVPSQKQTSAETKLTEKEQPQTNTENDVPDEQPSDAVVTVDLMPGVKPESSALGIYIYDGETILRRHLFETEAVRAQVMEAFHQAQVIPAQVDLTALQPPFYAIEMGAEEMGMIYGLWSDGYFITKTGEVYKFDYDFEALLSDYPWSEPDEFTNLTVMPGAKYVAKTDDGWNTAFMTEAEPLTPPQGITMQAQVEGDQITAQFINNTSEEWGYGYDFGLRVLVDDVWYYVPADQEMAFCEVLMLLQPGETSEETYSLSPYGKLPSGTYQFVTQNLAAEFAVE